MTVLLLSVALNIPILIFENFYSHSWFHSNPRSATVHISVPEFSKAQYLSLFPILYREPSTLWWILEDDETFPRTNNNNTHTFVTIEGFRFYNNSLFSAIEAYDVWPKPAFNLTYNAFYMSDNCYKSVFPTEEAPGLAVQLLTRDMPRHIANLIDVSAAECTAVTRRASGRSGVWRVSLNQSEEETGGLCRVLFGS
ncbi:uncharacterized protein SAPINGB_P002309 [Magnusiomyces paraingens]|uniref:Mannosyltransferase n=1 Tax=Magnusiomyces paraingens TaxID=2606893 RepID=A0A5E8BDJ3_9ASCO|nr:uncharacterized protein SAPINGB_P002309 [Saprochaete ingens]VVT49518.1 unnamed protein product [Saprochaete ingens]